MIDNNIVNIHHMCTGCSSCAQACPAHAITMKEDEEGFLFPEISAFKCISCYRCAKQCPVNNALEDRENNKTRPVDESVKVYACHARDEYTRLKSSSGGIFTVLARRFAEAPENLNSGAAVSPGAADTSETADASGASTAPVAPRDAGVPVAPGTSEVSGAPDTLRTSGVPGTPGASGNGYAIFGAAFDKDFNVKHDYIEDIRDIDRLRRSKYVQSDSGDMFFKAKQFLDKGKKVLYCGTPCQIAGLKAYLGRSYPKLLTCDIACHGVPSPKIWRMYLDFMKNRYGAEISDISFRDKSKGWNNAQMAITFKNGKQYLTDKNTDIFFIGFGKSIYNRKSCYDCLFRINNSRADITLADFWGIEKLISGSSAKPGSDNTGGGLESDDTGSTKTGSIKNDCPEKENLANDNKGVSCVIIHTPAGEKAFSAVRDLVVVDEFTLGDAIKYNPRLVSSCPEPERRKSFFADLGNGYNFDKLRKKYMDNFSLKYKAKRLIKGILSPGQIEKLKKFSGR